MSSKDNRPAGAIKFGELLGRSAKRNESIGQADKIDFYSFTSTQTFDLSVSLRLNSRASSNVKLELLNSAGGTILSSGGKTPSLTGEFDAGAYYIRIRRLKGDTKYTLSAAANLTEPGEVAGRERNLGTLSGASSSGESVGDTDDLDYYKFNLNSISDFTATLSGLSQSTRLSLYFDNGNGIIDTSDTRVAVDPSGSSSRNSNIATALPIGTYFVEVDYTGGTGSTAYTLNLTQTSRPGNVSPDPTATAPFTVAGSGTFSDLVGSIDGLDYYKFTLNQISDFGATLSGLSQRANMTLYQDNGNGIFDSSDKRTDSDSSGSSSRSGNITTALPVGTYFIEVDGFNYSSVNTRYDLVLTTTPRPGNVSPDPTATVPYSVAGSGTFSDLVGTLDGTDYYRLTVGQSTNLSATLSGLSKDVDLYLYQDNGNSLFDSNDTTITYDLKGSSSRNANISRSLTAGTYFVELRYGFNGSASNTRYDLSLGIG